MHLMQLSGQMSVMSFISCGGKDGKDEEGWSELLGKSGSNQTPNSRSWPPYLNTPGLSKSESKSSNDLATADMNSSERKLVVSGGGNNEGDADRSAERINEEEPIDEEGSVGV